MSRWILVVTLALLSAPGARAASPTAYDDSIATALRARDPRAESLFADANRARERSDLSAAVDDYGRVVQRVPDCWPAWRRLALVNLDAGRRGLAIQQLQWLLERDSSGYTLGALARALSEPVDDEQPTAEQLELANRFVERAVAADPGDVSARYTQWAVGFRRKDMAQMRQGAQALVGLEPDSAGSWWAMFTFGIVAHDERLATSALERAQRLGLPSENVEVSRRLLAEERKRRLERDAAWIAGGAVAGWLVLFGILLAAGLVLSRATLRAVERGPVETGARPEGTVALLRRTYAAVLWLCCAFYYASIPIVILLLLAAGGGVIYFLLRFAHTPVRLLLMVAVGTAVSVFAVVRGTFSRAREGDPGQRLDLEAHPRLRALLDEVAARIGTRPVDNVYLTPDAGVAVMERGGVGRQLRGSAERCLILGIAVLDGMTRRQLEAVLAHEYGHFINRDTAGGGFSFSVRLALMDTAHRLARGDAANWFNPAWLFVSGFSVVFMRISQGASRLQEVLADRWAALAYGAGAFADGLRHVVAASVRFEAWADATVNAALEAKRPLVNLYREAVELPADRRAELAARVAAELARAPGAYDSHPSPVQRIEWVGRIEAPVAPPADDREEAWALLADREAIEEGITAGLRTAIEAVHGVKFATAE